MILHHQAKLLRGHRGHTYQRGLRGDKQVTGGVIVGARLSRASASEVEGESKHGHGESQAAYSGQWVLKHTTEHNQHIHASHMVAERVSSSCGNEQDCVNAQTMGANQQWSSLFACLHGNCYDVARSGQ